MTDINKYNHTTACPLCNQVKELIVISDYKFGDQVCKDCKEKIFDPHKAILDNYINEHPTANIMNLIDEFKDKVIPPEKFGTNYSKYYNFLLGREPLMKKEQDRKAVLNKLLFELNENKKPKETNRLLEDLEEMKRHGR